MSSPCILLIDNDVRLLVKLETAFKRGGYRVLTASNSTQAIYLAQAALPEVILCDRTNELDVRSTLAQETQTASIPFIPLTKPLNQDELIANVNAVIRSHAVR